MTCELKRVSIPPAVDRFPTAGGRAKQKPPSLISMAARSAHARPTSRRTRQSRLLDRKAARRRRGLDGRRAVVTKVKRDDILSHSLRSTLTLSVLHGVSVGFTIEVMDTYIEGYISRTKAEGRGDFVAAVDFREDAPDYWRQCFVDLLPEEEVEDPGES